MSKKTIISVTVCLILAFTILILDIVSELQTREAFKKIDKALEETPIDYEIQYDQIEIDEYLNAYLSKLPEDLKENRDIRDAWVDGYMKGMINNLTIKTK